MEDNLENGDATVVVRDDSPRVTGDGLRVLMEDQEIIK